MPLDAATAAAETFAAEMTERLHEPVTSVLAPDAEPIGDFRPPPGRRIPDYLRNPAPLVKMISL